jgi:hypothetical protein
MSEEETKKEEKLSAKENAFVDAYLHGPSRFDATKAARVAGYKDNENLHTNANKLLQKTTIKAEIERRLDEVKLSKPAVLAGLADIANGDIADFMDIGPMGWSLSLLLHDESGKLLIDEVTNKPIRNPKTKLIKKLKQKVTTINGKDGEDKEIIETEIELYSAADAFVTMAKHHGLLKDTVALTGADGKDLIPDDSERLDAIQRKLAGIAAAVNAIEIPAQSDE